MKLADEVENLDDALQYIKDNVPGNELARFAYNPEKEIFSYHHGFGMALRNGFTLWGDSALSKWFKSKGILHADDMSGIILTSLHRKLNNQDIKLEEQIKYYRDYWIGIGINPDTMGEDII